MKVLHVIPSAGPRRGGPSCAIDAIAQALVDNDVEVDVATTDDNDDTRLSVPLLEPVTRSGATFRYFPRQSKLYCLSWPLRSWVQAHAREYDLIHTHALFSFAPVIAARAARAAQVPYVVRPLGTLAPYGLKQHPVLKTVSLRAFERAILDHAAAIHCTSGNEAAEVRALNPDWPTTIVPLGLDLEGISSVRDKSWLQGHAPHLRSRFLLLFLSRVDPKKGIETLLDSLARLRRSDVRIGVLLAGTGDARYTEELKLRARNLGVSADIVWVGHLSGADKAGALAAADAFVLPSKAENFGIAVAEALAAGLPVVISDQVGIHSDVTAGDAGIVTRADVVGVSNGIIRLMDPQERNRMSENARALAATRYSSKVMGARLAQLYREIVDRDVRSRN